MDDWYSGVMKMEIQHSDPGEDVRKLTNLVCMLVI